jgi:serine/threonine protein kinase
VPASTAYTRGRRRVTEHLHDRYRLERLLGEGASAQTWLATDLERDHRQVAVKILRVEHLENWKYFELFEREARVLAGLDHHGVPALVDYFEASADAGRSGLVLVQEFVEGQSLRARVEAGPRLGQTELLQLAGGLLEILDYLHGRAPPVYHRDIKPSNIILRPMGSVALVDFGSVCDGWRPVDEHGSTIVGTHGYMPPEQYMGKVGPSSDLYALGATLLYVMTGKHPREFDFEAGRIEVPAELPGPPSLRALICALLEPAPRDRPSSARDARNILLSDATDERSTSELAPIAKQARSLPAIIHTSKTAATFVDMGAPGRDPEGEFADVYRNLVPTHLRALGLSRTRPSRPPTGVDVLWYVTMTLLLFGTWPLLALWTQRQRQARYHDLFVDGVFVEGRIVGAGGVYEFEVGDERYRARDPSVATVHLVVGDRVGILYMPDDPRRSCIAYR